MKMRYFNGKVYKEKKSLDYMFMKRGVLILLITFSFAVSFVSAGDVIFRDGKITSSGNISSGDKLVGNGSQLTGNLTLFEQAGNIAFRVRLPEFPSGRSTGWSW